ILLTLEPGLFYGQGQSTIFSIGHTKIPSAPLALSSSITSQNVSLLITVCTELHPSSANGKTVGLFIPGKILIISLILSLGAFNKTYLYSLAFKTDFILN